MMAETAKPNERGEEEKSFSQNWLSHYGTISESSSVQEEVIWVEGRGAEIERRRGGVQEERVFYLFLSWL